MKNTMKTKLLITTLLSAATFGAAATPSFAQTDEIIVTGTRIKQKNAVATSPVTSVSSEDFAVRGTVNVEDLINELPQVFAGQGSNIGNGATGTATVNLRGLGASRTLVLIDGRRMGPGSPNAIASDLNQIPSVLIKNVDILTGGAGAVYGSDALAGVVNFEMDRQFEGVKLDVNIGAHQHNNNNDELQALLASSGNLNSQNSGNQLDGASKDFTLAFGTSFGEGKGNIVGYVGYREANEVLQGSRDYSACAFGSGRSAATAAPGVSCVGSSTTPTGRFFPESGGSFTLDENNTNEFRPWGGNPDTFNFNPTNHFQRPDERWTAGIFAEYDLTEKDTLYTDVMYMDDRSVAQIAFSGNFGVTTEVSCDNPFLSANQAAVICDRASFTPEAQQRFDDLNVAPLFFLRRNVEGDPRQDDLRHTSFRGVVGMRGDARFADGWEYDVFASQSQVHLANNYLNEIHQTRAQNALYATTGADGQPTCRGDLVTDAACVPINWFQIGGVTPDALSYVQGTGFQDGNVEQSVIQGVLTGDLNMLKSPLATLPASIAVGAEYRYDQYELRTDDNFSQGLLAGQGGATIGLEGEFDSYEVFGEMNLPLIVDAPLVDELTFNGAYRYADNSLSGGASSYSAGLIYQPVPALRVRGQYQRAVRAANALELFRAQSLGLFDTDDPCANGSTTVTAANPNGIAATAAQCANSGVTAAQYGNIDLNTAGQYNQLLGGNTNLSPEKSDTYTIGGVLTPTGALAGMVLSVDYFDIKVNDFIGQVPPDQTLNRCVFEGDPFFCSLINRNPANGSLWRTPDGFITATNLNTGSLSTSGIDANVTYGYDLGTKGRMTFNYNATYLLDITTESLPGDTPFDCAGFYGSSCGTPNPEYRHIASVGWNSPWNLDTKLTWRHFGNVDAFTDVGAEAGSFDESLGAQNYFDVAFTYRGIEDVTLRAGVNNILDREPPLSSAVGAGFGNGNTFPQVYDALGRYLFARATINF